MALIKAKDAKAMTPQEKEEKLKQLKFELAKANVTSQKQKAKTKEIKRAIARIITFINIGDKK